LTSELFFSPRWDDVEHYRDIFRKKRTEIWRKAPFWTEAKERILSFAKKTIVKIRTSFK